MMRRCKHNNNNNLLLTIIQRNGSSSSRPCSFHKRPLLLATSSRRLSFVQNLLGSPIGFESPWEATNSWIKPLEGQQILDIQSRHVLQLLQEHYQHKRPLSFDEVTTDRCNAVLNLLFSNGIHNTNDSRVFTHTERSDRAHDIMQAMQLFDEYPRTAGDRRLCAWPAPDRETYRAVLHLDSRTAGPARIPERALQVVWHLQDLYETRGQVQFKPHGFHWMCVFYAWKECTDEDKAQRALELLFKLRQDERVELNDTVYLTVLRLCAASPDEATIEGAVQLWNFLKDKELISHYYSAFLQVFRYLPNKKRVPLFEECFQQACHLGKVNQVILNEFLVHAKWQSLIAKYFGAYPISGLRPKQAVQVLVRSVPSSWMQNAD